LTTLVFHRKQLFGVGIPYCIYVNGQLVGMTRTGQFTNPFGTLNFGKKDGSSISHSGSKNHPFFCLNMPAGEYEIAIRIVFQLFKWQFWLGGSRTIAVADSEVKHLWITDHERIWNILFDIDMLLWVAEFFITLPSPWNMIYKIVSDGFFAIWLIRIWIIRKRYFEIRT